jgi:tRNA dimethylallyltransferase
LKYLITIIGPTAIGKTSLSIALAKYYNCEIVSCDSRQFFKEMRIGTAVPSEIELSQAKHHFIQNKSIFENYSVGDFEKEAISKLDELFTTNDFAVLVGGSGLYVDAVLKGFDAFPEIDETIRNKVRNNYEQKGLLYLQQKLQELDIDYFEILTNENPQTLQNPQRMMRFVEVCIGSGKPYSSFLNKEKNKRNFTPILIGLEAEREIIYDRINQRVDLMMSEGLLAEAKKLFPNKELNGLQTVGYHELFQYLDKEISFDFAVEEIKKNTRRFSKRQMTWFKRVANVTWFNYESELEKIINFIDLKIKEQ